LPISRAAWSSPARASATRRASSRRAPLAAVAIWPAMASGVIDRSGLFGDGVDPLGEREQYLFGAFQRRLIVGNLDILARGGQALSRRAATPRHAPMPTDPTRANAAAGSPSASNC
jgi:hypothetical protein